jgi:hypothetical protein
VNRYQEEIGQKVAERTSSIRGELEELAEAQHVLSERLNDIEQRLELVMRAEPPQIAGTDGRLRPVRDSSCWLDSRLVDLRSATRDHIDRVEAMLDRLQL